MPGARVALTTAVEVRSYSPIVGDSAADVVTHASGQRSPMRAAAARSWVSSRKLLNKATATASTPSVWNTARAASISATAKGASSWPSAAMRPPMPCLRYRGTSTGA